MISDRRKKIFQAIVEEYIKTAIPISSNSLIDSNDFNYSSATIRNEMAELEKKRLIKKTHTSSGRIPSQKGYRYYVNELLNNSVLNQSEIEFINNIFDQKVNDLNNLASMTAKIISEITNYTTITISKKDNLEIIKEVKFVELSSNLLLVIIITNNNTIKETIIRYDIELPKQVIDILTKIFNIKMVGKRLNEINVPLDELLMQDTKDLMMYIIPIIKKLKDELNIKQNSDNIHFEGTNNLLDYPEFDNIDNIKKLMYILNQKSILDDLLQNLDSKKTLNNTMSNIKVSIGDETNSKILDDFSIITYDNSDNLGIIGILGPQRMDYAKVISVIEFINKKIDELDKNL